MFLIKVKEFHFMYAVHSNSRDSLIAKKRIAINTHIKPELVLDGAIRVKNE